MSETVGLVVIGAGQAGLAVSHELTELGIEHVVLEKGRIGQTWRDRWESFCLVTPNWSVQLPGHPYDGDYPDGGSCEWLGSGTAPGDDRQRDGDAA